MPWIFSVVPLFILLLQCLPVTIGEQSKATVVDNGSDGFNGRIKLTITDDVTDGVPSRASKYNYGEVLKLSILFYEAQRSGKLPKNNRVKWRKDSALNDKGQNGEDLRGGWYDAGDYVKFGFPMASSVTVLAWGLVEYKKAYTAAGQYNHMLNSIKWATDYFIKAHTKRDEFYGQVCMSYPLSVLLSRTETTSLLKSGIIALTF